MVDGKEKMNDIPQPIKTVVTKPQEKLYVLHLEKDLIAFIKESILLKREPPVYTIHSGVLKNSYYRLLSHQVCHHYHLQHWNNGSNDIIVTLSSDGFDYEKFSEVLDLKEDKSFTKICDYIQQKGCNGNNSEADEISTKIIKPKMIIRKESPRNSIPLAGTLSEITQTSIFLSTGEPNGKTQNVFSDTPNTSTPALTGSLKSGSDNIEVERASKEALYLKVREKIFQDQQDDDEDQEEEAEEQEDDDIDDSDEDTTHSSMIDSKAGFKSQDNIHHNGFNGLDHNSYQYNGGVPPVPMGMPINYNSNMNVPPFMNPNSYFSSPNQSIYPPHMNMYNQYPNYFPSPPMIPPQNGFYSNAYKGNHQYTPYDKETERKLLNNPYIIIPDSNRDKKPKKPYKPRNYISHSNPNSN